MKWIKNRQRALVIVIVTLLLTLFFGYQNLYVPSSGIIKDALLDSNNRYYQWQRIADQYESLNKGDALSFLIAFPDGIDRKGIKQIIEMTDDIKKLFPEGTVWSLSTNSYDYLAKDSFIESRPHLSPQLVDPNGTLSGSFDLEGWKHQVALDKSAYGVLIGENFDFSQIFVFLPKEYSEQEIADRTGEYLEQRNIYRAEWLLFKDDIHPAEPFENVALGGWSVARGLMHYALISNVLFYSTIGLLIATLAAFFSLGSRRQAIYTAVTIFISFILVRGTIPILADVGLEFYGLPIYERVYFLLVLSAMIVAGISFNVRALEAYNDIWRENPGLAREKIWQKVSPIGTKFNIVAIIAIINFATLPQIGIRGILEVGVLSAIGIVYQRMLVSFFLPSIHILFGGSQKEIKSRSLIRLIDQYNRLIDYIPQRCFAFISRYSPRKSLVLSLSVTFGTLAVALFIIGHDVVSENKWILIQEKPIDYLPDTIVDRGREILNHGDNYGFGRLPFFIVPKQGLWDAPPPGYAPSEDPAFIRDVYLLSQKIADIEGARTSRSILDKVRQISERTAEYHGPLPETFQQAHDIFQMIEWDLDDPGLARYMWTADGIVIYASHKADNSRNLRKFSQSVIHLIESDFSHLQAIPFGRLHTYHQTDRYISQRKPLNVLTSFPSVVVVCAVWLFMANAARVLGGHRRVLKPLLTGLAMSVPFLFSYSVILILMAIFRLPLDQATACASALGINAAIDFDVYIVNDFMEAIFEGRSLDEGLAYALRDRGRVTLIDVKLNAICFSFLMFSQFIPIQRLGAIMVIMLITCGFGALVLMTGILRSCTAVRQEYSIGERVALKILNKVEEKQRQVI